MSIRFRRSIKLAPGIRLNLSGSGASWSIGPRGASINVGKRGTRLNTSFAGFSSSQRLSSPQVHRASTARPPATKQLVTVVIEDDGTIRYLDASGNPMPDALVEQLKKQNKEGLLARIQEQCDKINANIAAMGQMHLDTPPCNVPPRFTPVRFLKPQPAPYQPLKPGFLDKLFKGHLAKLEEQNRQNAMRHGAAVQQWQQEFAAFNASVDARKKFIEQDIYVDDNAMAAWLDETLQEIVWPRETSISFDIAEAGKRVMLDVDLPEIEEMPTRNAAVPSRGIKLSVKELSATDVRKLYLEHIHGIAFRLIGEVFAALPTVETVVFSGFSQRRAAETAQLQNEYLLSVRVARELWAEIAFEHLAHIDVVQALTRFDLRRTMTKTGIMKAIEPFES
jgi:hypothetical protein